MMRRGSFLLLLLAGLMLGGWAQPDPDKPQPDAMDFWGKRLGALLVALNKPFNDHTLLAQTPQGLFILRNGVLAKYDVATLAERGVLELFGPVPAPPADKADGDAQFEWQFDQGKRQLPAEMVVHKTGLLIVVGEEFFRVEMATLQIAARSSLAPANAPFNKERLAELLASPTLEAGERILHIVRGSQLSAVNIADGRVLATITLPEAMQPKPLPVERKAERRPLRQAPLPRKGAKAPAAPVAPQEIVTVGTLHHQQGENGVDDCWFVQDDFGNARVLTGVKAKALIALPQVAGKRVRLSGILTFDDEGDAFLEVNTYELLTK